MTAPNLVTLNGVPGSPYTRKMLAVLRYRRIAYRLILGSHDVVGMPKPKVNLLPTFYFPGPDGTLQAVTDSTPILRRLEGEYPERRIRPADPALAFLDSLIEDYGDEWLTKAMFHYRWAHQADVRKAAAVLPAWTRGALSDADLKTFGDSFAERQVERLRYVGSNAITGPVIEASYRRFLDLMEAHLQTHRFVLGARPGAGDFGVFGQLTQLAQFDPTPMALTAEVAPRVFAWVSAMEDLTGLEPRESDWFDAAALPATVHALLVEIGRVYAPLLLANARAVNAGEAQFETRIDGQPWVQQPFTYQAKCLAWLREEYAGLAAGPRATVDRVLAGTGCEALFASA